MKHKIDTVSIKEAAAILGISVAGMRSKVHRRMNEERGSSTPIPKPKRMKYRGQYRWVFDRARLEKYRDSLI